MEASVVDLRYKMKDVLKALERGETVTVLHRGTVKGTLVPASKTTTMKVEEHPFFGSEAADEPVDEVMDVLRRPRYRDS